MKDTKKFKITMEVIEECLEESLENDNIYKNKEKPNFVSTR